MKIGNGLFLCVIALTTLAGGCAMLVGSPSGAHQVNSKVGIDPGEIRTAEDPDAVAAARHHELATFAAGCFWGVESAFRKTKGVVATAVGYSGGKSKNPSYKEVCTDTTGHAEAVLVEFDPKLISYTDLLEVFWTYHDPTQLNRQGPDFGTQYRSAILYRSESQRKIAVDSRNKLNKSGEFKTPVVTEIAHAKTFWLAEEYHQQYAEKTGHDSCPAPRKRIKQ